MGDTLGNCHHHAFPVIDYDTHRFMGLLERSTLLHVLAFGKKHGVFFDDSSTVDNKQNILPFVEMVRHNHPACPSYTAVKSLLAANDYDMSINLLPYTNKGCYTLQEYAAGARCYMLFRTMGLRHLPVLGDDHTVRGIITRKDLLRAAEGDLPAPRSQSCSRGSTRASLSTRRTSLSTRISLESSTNAADVLRI